MYASCKLTLSLAMSVGLVALAGCGGGEGVDSAPAPNSAPEKADAAAPTKADDAVSFDDVKKETQDALNTLTGFVFTKKDEYKKQIDAQVATWSQQIDEFEKQAMSATGEAKKQLDMQVAQLKEQLAAVKSQMPALEEATQKTWDDARNNMNKALTGLVDAVNKATDGKGQ